MPNGSGRKTYEENMYEWLKKCGYGEKYEHPGIYSISIDDQLVYIGKSNNMLRRLAQHYVGIKRRTERKYRIMADAQKQGHRISFDVLYYAQKRYRSGVEEEIGEKEAEYIRQYHPALNYQIPKAEDWRKFEVNELAHTITLAEILESQITSI